MSRTLQLGAGVEATIRAHATETYPHECCGALVGRDGVVDAAVPLPNTTSDGPRRRFLVQPADYRAAERAATESGGALLGFYHSHPDHPAVPSQFDLDHAWPNLSYIIISVKQRQPDEMRSWRLKADRSGYDEERIENAS